MSSADAAPVIFGCAGPVLGEAECAFFRAVQPLGFILFKRNIESPEQVRTLVAALRGCLEREGAPVLIDQEGGRVARLGPPHWRRPPAAARFAELYRRDPAAAVHAARLNAWLIGRELAALGIDVDCAPVADIPAPGAHDVIGDRAYGATPEQVATLARATMEGLLDAGVMPVVKHIPGHGRARADSHLELPVVDAPRAALAQTDFAAFRALADAPWAMTAHIQYSAIDPARPATLSPAVIEVIRTEIGFGGVLISDDLGMKALRAPFDRLAADALAAGCDLVLHCSGDMAEMQQVAKGLSPMTAAARERLALANRRRRSVAPEGFAAAALDRLLEAAA